MQRYTSFDEKDNRALARDILGLLHLAGRELGHVTLTPELAGDLCNRVEELCGSIQKAAQDMASENGEKDTEGGD